jgi:hypothetical protein
VKLDWHNSSHFFAFAAMLSVTVFNDKLQPMLRTTKRNFVVTQSGEQSTELSHAPKRPKGPITRSLPHTDEPGPPTQPDVNGRAIIGEVQSGMDDEDDFCDFDGGDYLDGS